MDPPIFRNSYMLPKEATDFPRRAQVQEFLDACSFQDVLPDTGGLELPEDQGSKSCRRYELPSTPTIVGPRYRWT